MSAIQADQGSSTAPNDIELNDKRVYHYSAAEKPDVGILSAEEATDLAIAEIEEVFTIDSDNSPFAEVRANVPATDDPEMPVNTLRAWVLGIVFTMLGRWVDVQHTGAYPWFIADTSNQRHQPIL